MAKYKIGDTITFNSFGEVKTMVVANVIDPNSTNPMYEDKDGSAIFEDDLIKQDGRCYNCVKSTFFHHYCKELKCWIKSPKIMCCKHWTDTKLLLGGTEYYKMYE